MYTREGRLTDLKQCFPVVVALETSPNNVLSGRASTLHGLLHAKHTSLLNARFAVSARASFEYQKKSSRSPVCGMKLMLVTYPRSLSFS